MLMAGRSARPRASCRWISGLPWQTGAWVSRKRAPSTLAPASTARGERGYRWPATGRLSCSCGGSGQYDVRVPIALALPVVAPAPVQPAATAQQSALLTPNLGLTLGVAAVGVSLAALLVSVIGPPLLSTRLAIARSSSVVLGATGMIAGFVMLHAGLAAETIPSQGAVLSQYAAAVPPMDVENPISPTEESLSRGRVIYQQHCQVCHGDQGRGDGPAVASLRRTTRRPGVPCLSASRRAILRLVHPRHSRYGDAPPSQRRFRRRIAGTSSTTSTHLPRRRVESVGRA